MFYKNGGTEKKKKKAGGSGGKNGETERIGYRCPWLSRATDLVQRSLPSRRDPQDEVV